MTRVDVGLDHLAEVGFVRFVHCKVPSSFSLSVLSFLGGNHCAVHTRREELHFTSGREEYSHRLFSLLLNLENIYLLSHISTHWYKSLNFMSPQENIALLRIWHILWRTSILGHSVRSSCFGPISSLWNDLSLIFYSFIYISMGSWVFILSFGL